MAGPDTLSATHTTNVLIVDDHPVVREGLALHIGAQADMRVCGEAEDVTDALQLLDNCKPDVAVIDISLKTGNGLDLIKRVRGRNEHIRIVVWSMYPENLYAERALRAGALGYVHKGRATKNIIEAIRCVRSGTIYVSEEISSLLLSRLVGGGTNGPSTDAVESLSDRELEAFRLMGHGRTTEEIAEQMHVSPKTVETYRARIKEKLNLSNATELIHRASQWVLEND